MTKVRVTCPLCNDTRVYWIAVPYQSFLWFCVSYYCVRYSKVHNWDDICCKVLNPRVREPRAHVKMGRYA